MTDPVSPAADLEALLARIAERTGVLRAAPDAPAARERERQLLADLSRAAAGLRADASAIGESLARIIESTPPAERTPDET